MSRVPPPEHTRFKPGESGNRSGRPKLTPELRAIKQLTTDELKRTISKWFRTTYEELEKIDKDPKETGLNRLLVSSILRAIKEGDPYKAEALFQRCLGKITEKVEVQHPEPVVIQKIDGSQTVLDAEIDDRETEEGEEQDEIRP